MVTHKPQVDYFQITPWSQVHSFPYSTVIWQQYIFSIVLAQIKSKLQSFLAKKSGVLDHVWMKLLDFN